MGATKAPLQKTVQQSSTSSTQAIAASKTQKSLEDSLYIVQVGDYTTIKVPSSYFFTQNTANLVSNFYNNIQSLANVVKQYKPSVIKVHAVFPVPEKTERFDAIANNQADIFVAKLSQYTDDNITSGVGQLVNSKTVFNPEYMTVGEYIELQLSPKQ